MKEDTVAIADWIFPSAFFAMLITPGIWAYQVYHWLRWGEWQSISTADWLVWTGARTPTFAWDGVQKLSDWLLSAPLSITVFVVVIGILFAFIEWSDRRFKGMLNETDL